MSRAIALANQKGGVGKTTCCVNLAAGLAGAGKRVLLVDVDPQANASIHLGVEVHRLERTLYDVLVSDAPADEVLVREVRERLDLLPAGLDLSAAEVELAGEVGREAVLAGALDGVRDAYDFVLFDCPPSLGLLAINAFCASREVFIPVQTEFFALRGISKLVEVVALVRRRLNPMLRVTGVIATMVDMRTNLAREVLEDVRNFFGGRVFETVIRVNVRLAEAPGFGKTIFEYDSGSHGAEDFTSLAREVLGMRAL